MFIALPVGGITLVALFIGMDVMFKSQKGRRILLLIRQKEDSWIVQSIKLIVCVVFVFKIITLFWKVVEGK